MGITFLTGNSGKFKDAQSLFGGSNIELKQQSFEIPEIQSF
jgi:inosine/xanthosine triphosphate pyrophosphatase family protein